MQRYARQLLLKPVGGRGQEALLSSPVELWGVETAAAYLAAGGTPVKTNCTDSFLAGNHISAFNSEVPAFTADGAGVIARVPFEFSPAAIRAVAVGSDAVVFRNGGCLACFKLNLEDLHVGDASVMVDALAALAWQRIALGLAEPLGVLRPYGAPLQLLRCEAHR